MKKILSSFTFFLKNNFLLFLLFIFFNIFVVFGNNLSIPEIIIEVQSGLNKVGDDIYECKNEKCKINLNVEKIFSGSYSKNDFKCEWDFGYGTFTTLNTDKKCNPGYVNYGTGEFDLSVKVIEKNNNFNFKQKFFKIFNGVDFGFINSDNEFIINNNLDYGYGNNNNLDYGYGSSSNISSNINNNQELINQKKDIPEIIFNFQRPSYVLNDNNNLEKFICDSTKDECKINFDLRKSFVDDFSEGDYICNIDFGIGNITGEENKCNPNTVIFPNGEFEILFKIIDKDNLDNFKVKKIFLKNNFIDDINNKNNILENKDNSENIDNNIFDKQNIILKNIEIQSGLKKDINGFYFCDKEICSINLNYENDNKNILCEWNFGDGKFSTTDTNKKCNPGYVKYGVGNHKIKLKLYDKNFENNYKETLIEFENIYGTGKKIVEEINTKEEIIDEKLEKILDENNFDYDMLKFVKFNNILVNPNGSDIGEYIELKNSGNDDVNLKGCFIDDILNKGSKKYIFYNDFFIKKNEIVKLEKYITKINLNNTGDELHLICGKNEIDKLMWNFSVDSGLLLNKEIIKKIKLGEITKQEVLDNKNPFEKLKSEIDNIFDNNFFVKISKLKSGLKIYGKIFSNSKILVKISGNKINKDITLNTGKKGNFEYKIYDLKELGYGEFTINYFLINEKGFEFKLFDTKKIKITKEKFLSNQKYIYNQKIKDENQSLNYLGKYINSLEKDFIKNLDKLLKPKKTKAQSLKKYKLPGEKLKKVEIFETKKGFVKEYNKNGFFYNFAIIIISFILVFILLKREKII